MPALIWAARIQNVTMGISNSEILLRSWTMNSFPGWITESLRASAQSESPIASDEAITGCSQYFILLSINIQLHYLALESSNWPAVWLPCMTWTHTPGKPQRISRHKFWKFKGFLHNEKTNTRVIPLAVILVGLLYASKPCITLLRLTMQLMIR